MASLGKVSWVLPNFSLNSEYKPQFRAEVKCSASGDSVVLSSDSVRVNGVSSVKEKVRIECSVNEGNGELGPIIEEKKSGEDVVSEKLEVLWDDGYGTQTVKEYFESAKELIKPDGGPPRWFCPLSCGRPLKKSPLLLFLPGMDGLGSGLVLHEKALGKVFEVRCLHIPVYDRTPFEDLMKFVEETVRLEHASSPNKPIYLVGDSFGGCLALAVAAHNPKVDLVVVLANPATSFGRSQLQPLLPLLEGLPDELQLMVPYLLSFVMGDPMKMAMVDINKTLPPAPVLQQLSGNLTALLPYLSGLADIIPKDTLLWKLKLLKSAAAYANSRLHAVTAEVLVLASGKDSLLPSKNEAQRLSRLLKNCRIRYFKDNGHTILLEDVVNLLTVIKGSLKYRRTRRLDYVADFVPPSRSEFLEALESNRWLRLAASPVMLSTLEDGKIVRGLSGVPDQGPVLLVGYHMLLGLELIPLIEQFLIEKKILVRGVAHPTLFTPSADENQFTSYFDMIRVFGGLPVSARNFFKLFSTKSHVLLYPGGAREALHRKGEKYKLFWPDQPEFVRMAAKFGATIVPFGAVGEDDVAELVLDYNDVMRIPVLNDYTRKINEDSDIRLRTDMAGEVADQDLYLPGLLPKVPGRFYYLFGKPIKTKGREKILRDRESAKELYLQIKSEVESSMAYLIKKREEDPYRNIVDRNVYRAVFAPVDNRVPTFEA